MKENFDEQIANSGLFNSKPKIDFIKYLKTATEETKNKVQVTLSTDNFDITENQSDILSIIKRDLLYSFSSHNKLNKYWCHKIMVHLIYN